MATIPPPIWQGTVLPGRVSIHSTAWFIAHERAQVILLKYMPAVQPPNAMLISPQGTSKVAKGSTIRFAKRKYELI